MTVERAAEKIVACVDRPQRELVLSVAGQALVRLNAIAPGWLDALLLAWRRRERT
jgi:hypothetical protein